ncbi:hypothetical protein LOD99_10138 [Oopsacas minuta]|uniref:VWFA domain-containing protein n=1 Tax=Oopsacas minuta TaxID=111878 RepID=A0AAV7KK83_9METZ|nr:hypothetical protein LOD99_10138 [Oopsacas minuta]
MATNTKGGVGLKEFLEAQGLEKYEDTFKLVGTRNMDDLVDFDLNMLTEDICMTKLEAKRFLRKLTEMFGGKVNNFAPSLSQIEPDLSEMNDKAYRMQTRREKLDIQYMLLTTQTPDKRTIGPLNTNQTLYCDLVNRICMQEHNELGDDLTVELYTCEGYPLATRPISYISKLSDWCLEEYPDIPMVYAIPRLICYSDKIARYTQADTLCRGNDTILIRNKECGLEPRGIQTDCSIATYYQLIKRIQDMTGIPGHLIQLYRDDTLVYSSNDVVLSDLNIGNQVALEIRPNKHFWSLGKDKNFNISECKPTWYKEQSSYGASFFFSCLYALSDWMVEQEQVRNGIPFNTLGHLRGITGCPPLIHSLHLLFTREALSLPHRVAIQECLVQIFKVIKPKTPKLHMPGTVTIETSQVTEYSNYFWVYFIDHAKPGHQNTEKYDKYPLTCSETHQRMTDPVKVRDNNGMDHYVEKSILNESTELTMIQYLYNYKRMVKSFITDEAVVWRCTAAPTCGIDLTGEWKNLERKTDKYSVLCVQAPLNVKAPQCRKSTMITTDDGHIGVYIDTSKDPNKPHVYFQVTTGVSILFDADDMDRQIKENPPVCFRKLKTLTNVMSHGMEGITRDPVEIIMVVLDVSGSMTFPYLDGKAKFHSVVEAFEAFCNRTTAYDLKHVIGLTLFATDSKLQYPISENFRAFNSEFTSFPPGNSTSVYNAIRFAVQRMNKFVSRHPELHDVSKRILCLTDGYDNNSTVTADEAAQLLIDSQVTMDCVLLCEEVVDTHAIAKATGGYSFKPTDTKELLNIFEEEPMLSMNSRLNCIPAYVTGEDINLEAQAAEPIDTQLDHILPDKLNLPVQTAQKCLARALINKHLACNINTDFTKRILQELSYYQSSSTSSI